MTIEKKETKLEFKKKKCGLGFVYSLNLQSLNLIASIAINREDKTRRVHELFCHSNMIQAKIAAKKIGINVDNVDNFIDCQACKMSKAAQKPVSKQDSNRSNLPGERLCIDISSIKTELINNKKFWVLVKDQATCMKWSFFVKQKSDQVQPIIDLIREINSMKNQCVKYIRCDNTGENYLLETECKKQGLPVKFEFTSRNTPQQNGQVERSFATLYSKICAMMNAARMNQQEKEKYWIEAAATATKVDNLLIRKGEKAGPHINFIWRIQIIRII